MQMSCGWKEHGVFKELQESRWCVWRILGRRVARAEDEVTGGSSGLACHGKVWGFRFKAYE